MPKDTWNDVIVHDANRLLLREVGFPSGLGSQVQGQHFSARIPGCDPRAAGTLNPRNITSQKVEIFETNSLGLPTGSR
ncbi:hypothetical protein VTK56DRAFT_5835 [Thermocarpiscus australiensis]